MRNEFILNIGEWVVGQGDVAPEYMEWYRNVSHPFVICSDGNQPISTTLPPNKGGGTTTCGSLLKGLPKAIVAKVVRILVKFS